MSSELALWITRISKLSKVLHSGFEIKICERFAAADWVAIVGTSTKCSRGEGKTLEDALKAVEQALTREISEKLSAKQGEVDLLRESIEGLEIAPIKKESSPW